MAILLSLRAELLGGFRVLVDGHPKFSDHRSCGGTPARTFQERRGS
jgi:hypothetical protein